MERNNDIVKIIREITFDIDFNYTKSLISPTQRKQILSDFEKSNNNVAKKYLNRDKLFDYLSIEDDENWEYEILSRMGIMILQ